MKKLMLTLLVACLSLGAFSEARANETWEKLALYLPNRVMDLLDIFSVNIGAGPTARIELMGTRMVSGGIGAGGAAMLYKDYNRQYGWGWQNGWNWELPGVLQEDTERTATSRWVTEYWESGFGMPLPSQQIYEYYEGPRDYWQIGGALGLGIVGEVYIHPIEWADLALGFFFIDIRDDDLTFVSFE